MNTMWVIVALCLGAVALAVIMMMRNRIDTTELGNVSTQWLSEQRAQDRDFRLR
jgi:hypothetical protein